jgi:hypothetical protein
VRKALDLTQQEEQSIIRMYKGQNLSPAAISRQLGGSPSKSWITKFLIRKEEWTGSKAGRPKGERHKQHMREAAINRYSDPRQREIMSKIQKRIYKDEEKRLAQSDRLKKLIANGYTSYISPGEHIVKDFLTSKGFIFQYAFPYSRNQRGHIESNVKMDFYHKKLRVNIEIDGISHESSEETDRKRDSKLKEHRVTVLRVKETSSILQEIESITNTLGV